MEGPIIAEFSSLNALKAPVGPRASSQGGPRPVAAGSFSARGPRRVPEDDGRQPPSSAPAISRAERLLRGESTYTSVSSDARINKHFIEDQPQSLPHGVAYLLPKASTTEDRERLLRRLEMCAKAREESTKILSIRFAERDAVKKDLKVERQTVVERHHASQKDREDRWSRRLGRSPFHIDLVAESQRIDEESRVRELLEKKRLKAAMEKSREAHNKIFMRAMAESDELEQLRLEKRLLLENEKQLKALRDVERSNARTAQILQARKERQKEQEAEIKS